jgi:hypothetical protein
VTSYPVAGDLARWALRVPMLRAPRLHAAGATVHAVAQCNNREFYLTSAEDFELMLILGHVGADTTYEIGDAERVARLVRVVRDPYWRTSSRCRTNMRNWGAGRVG